MSWYQTFAYYFVLDTCGFKGRSQYTRWMRDIQYETGLFSENCRISRHHTSPGAAFTA
ncbi:hypothetical protein FORC88_191 [Salmonella enterica subsp. enterica serovar Typhimurium]|nr:hypothetical protein FORC88_191 [Salmonella enterica subsp. enterica serovar Typhimurium]